MPHDIALIGFDDIYPATLCDPPLTTVNQPIRSIGERSCERLIERIAHPTLRPAVELLPTELVIRHQLRLPARHGDQKAGGDRRPGALPLPSEATTAGGQTSTGQNPDSKTRSTTRSKKGRWRACRSSCAASPSTW